VGDSTPQGPKPVAGGIIYRAAFVLPVISAPVRDGFVAVQDGVVLDVGPAAGRPRGHGVREIDLGETILLPGFVNAHTHLELSHLSGAVPGDSGFVGWIEEQLRLRADRPASQIQAGIGAAIAALEANGTAAVADVTNSLAAVSALAESSLHALVLHEVLGFDPAKADQVLAQIRAARLAAAPALSGATPRVSLAAAAHAPHSLSPALLKRLLADEGIRSIHLAESRCEAEFLRDGAGEWRGFLDRRVGPIPFETRSESPVRYLDTLGALVPGLLAVHCVHVDEDDAKILAARGAVAVLCPRSNEFLGNGVPPLAMLLGHGVPIALGTDSLASCPSLNVIEDARFLARKFPRVPGSALLHALTRGGAAALGFDGLGGLGPGRPAKMAAIPFNGVPPHDPIAFVLNEAAPVGGVVRL
jgi:aminodeoxyfutalosine deaminase